MKPCGEVIVEIINNVELTCKWCGKKVIGQIYKNCNSHVSNGVMIDPGKDIECYWCDSCNMGTGPSIGGSW